MSQPGETISSPWAAEIDRIERDLLAIRGIQVRVERDSLGWLKVRVLWDAFIVAEIAVSNDQDWRDVLKWALAYVRARKVAG